jgi:NAD(P)H-hydrate epimerase
MLTALGWWQGRKDRKNTPWASLCALAFAALTVLMACRWEERSYLLAGFLMMVFLANFLALAWGLRRKPGTVWKVDADHLTPYQERLRPLPRRSRTAHKGTFGRIFVLAGAEGYTGAPVLASRAAVRAGAGLVFLGVPRAIYPIVAVKCDEAMPFPLPQEYGKILQKAAGCDLALIGPGLGRSPETDQLVRSLLVDLEIPVVLDADGLNALAGHMDILDRRSAFTVLTPHEGEFQRLTGCELPIRDRLSTAREFAAVHRCVLVLKGHDTVTAAPDGRAWINPTGNPGMAKGGSGDVLAGLLAGLLGQRHLLGPAGDPSELVAQGVYIHGAAGDRCAQELGEYAMTPSDLLERLPEVLREQEAR